MTIELLTRICAPAYLEKKTQLLQSYQTDLTETGLEGGMDFGRMNELIHSLDFLQLRQDVRMAYLFCLVIRPSVEKNKGTHTQEIFGQVMENLVQIAQQCDDFIKEVAYYDPDSQVLRMKSKLEHAKELEKFSEEERLNYYHQIDELFLTRNRFQTYRDLETMLYNMSCNLLELHGLILSNKDQIRDFIEFQKRGH